jgi:hypothetical protein
MGESEFSIGADVRCTDGPGGEVRKVVVDPVARVLTHLVVEERHRDGLGRLVPLSLVGASDGGAVTLTCTREELGALPRAEEVQFLPGAQGLLGYETPDVLPLPYYLLGANDTVPPTVGDLVPAGELAFRRDDRVHATDGEVGRVEGFGVDPTSRAVTHLLLQEGHVLGHRDVAIPVAHVAAMDADGVSLDLSRDEVAALPAVEVAR